MEIEHVEKEVAQRSARIYLLVAFGAALVFLLVASLTGDYEPVARYGGAAWIFLLSLIVSMPIIITRVKKAVRK